MGYTVVGPDELDWETRPSDPGDAERHRAALTERAGLQHTRANLWRYEPGAQGRRHRDLVQEETFIVIGGALTMYLGDPPERREVPRGGLIHVEAGTPLQIVNEARAALLLRAYGSPRDPAAAQLLDSAV